MSKQAQFITPFLWFDGKAEEAAELYTSLFPNSRIKTISRYGKKGFVQHGQPEGLATVVVMELDGYQISGHNGGPIFKPTPALSFFVQLETEELVDKVWAGLLNGGSVMMPLEAQEWSPKFGWLNDRYGISWQITLGPKADVRQTISPALLFVGEKHGKAEAALEHYTRIFPNSSVDNVLKYDGSGIEPEGTITNAQFYLNGETFMVMDGAGEHPFDFNEAFSLNISCETQDEIDAYWNGLLENGGEPGPCGWLKDAFGVSWQIVPSTMGQLMTDTRPGVSGRVMEAMLKMTKIDKAALEAAAEA